MAPGTADLTADVDFSYLRRMAQDRVGSLGPVPQQEFLRNMGIDVRLKVRPGPCPYPAPPASVLESGGWGRLSLVPAVAPGEVGGEPPTNVFVCVWVWTSHPEVLACWPSVGLEVGSTVGALSCRGSPGHGCALWALPAGVWGFSSQVLLEKAEEPAQKQQLLQGYHMLMDPQQMGQRFHFFALLPLQRLQGPGQPASGRRRGQASAGSVAGFGELAWR